MKKFLFGIISTIVFLSIVSCNTLTSRNQGIFGKSSSKASKQADRVITLEKKEAVNGEDRLTHIGAWSSGAKYALDKVSEPPKEVIVAKTVNERIAALANKPDFNEEKEVRAIIDGLLSEMKEQQSLAVKSLDKKDKEISSLNQDLKDLTLQKQSEISIAMKLSEENAAKADQYKATLNDMDSFFGLSAIWYGVKKLISRLMWTIIIVGVLFLVLRIAAASNPIAGAIFGIFEQIVSWFIRGLKMLAPKAASFSGFVETKIFDGYKKTLTYIIDEIQMMKAKDDAVKDKYTLDDLMESLEKSMDTDDKERVRLIKRDLNWK